MPVNKSVESQAIPPAGGEVVNVDLRVSGETGNKEQHHEKLLMSFSIKAV